MRYLCALPNIKRPGRIPELFLEDDDEGLEAFRAKWDKEGWGVFECVSPLKPGSRRRNLENVAALAQFHVDVDFKDLTESPDEVRAKLLSLPLEPTEVRSSGGGYHLVWALKEPVEAGDPDFAGACALLRQLTQRLGGDPAPAHPAALLRLPGTTNSKREPHVQVTPQWGSGAPVDITEVGTLVDLLGERTLLTPKAMARPKTNGHCHNDVFVPDPEAVPVDVDQRLAHMEFGGAGEAGIHVTQVSATAALLCRGVGVEEAVATVLEATQRAVAGDPRVSSWDWDEEQRGLEQMCFAWVNKHPELSNVLPDKLREPFERHLAEGRGAQITFASTAGGWHARGRKHRLNGVEGAAAPKRLSFKLRPFVPIDPATLPPRQWLYGKHFQRRTVSATVAPGGFGKTSLCMVEAVAMATARDLLGEQPSARLRVWYHNGDDSHDELSRRLVAICQHYSIPQEELPGWFFFTSGHEVPLRVAKGYNDLHLDDPLIAAIRNEVSGKEIDVAILDPLVTLHGVSEGDNSRMDTVIRIFAGIADSEQCSVELAHHTRKLPAGTTPTDYSGDDMRGASAIKDAVRAARMLNHMTSREAEELAIPEHERTSYFRVDRVKGNNAPPSKAVWRRFVGVDLPNGDDVGVVEPWILPGMGAPSEAMAEAERRAEDIYMALLVRFTLQGRPVSDRAGRNFAPLVFSREPEAKKARVSKKVLEDAQVRLFAKNKIRVESEGTANHRIYRLVIA